VAARARRRGAAETAGTERSIVHSRVRAGQVLGRFGQEVQPSFFDERLPAWMDMARVNS